MQEQKKSTTEEHTHWMQMCLELGRQALQSGNPPVGSLVVQAGVRIGQGVEAGKTQRDITFHAEIEAIRDAIRHTGANHLASCILYTTHEPCLMCSYVIRHYQVSQVVFGVEVPHIGGYSSAYPIVTAHDIPIWSSPPLVISGVCREACAQLSQEYRTM